MATSSRCNMRRRSSSSSGLGAVCGACSAIPARDLPVRSCVRQRRRTMFSVMRNSQGAGLRSSGSSPSPPVHHQENLLHDVLRLHRRPGQLRRPAGHRRAVVAIQAVGVELRVAGFRNESRCPTLTNSCGCHAGQRTATGVPAELAAPFSRESAGAEAAALAAGGSTLQGRAASWGLDPPAPAARAARSRASERRRLRRRSPSREVWNPPRVPGHGR